MGEHQVPARQAGGGSRRVSLMPKLSVAPMMDITDRHFRNFVRQITRHTLLYTEMVTEQALRFGDAERLLRFDGVEHPVSLQLGGSDSAGLVHAARLGHAAGYDEINLNVGCPSDRVQSGKFGACLMLEPGLVRDLLAAIRDAVPLPVTVKHRIGVDENDSFAELLAFVDTVAESGVTRFTVHARKAWLQGLSPRENREIPPLDYGMVARLRQLRPELQFELNGGVRDLDQAARLLADFDAVMLGRAVAEDPFVLAGADMLLAGEPGPAADPFEAVRSWLPYVEAELQAGSRMRPLVKPLLGMFGGMRGARLWRRTLSEGAGRDDAGPELIERALELVTPVPASGPDAAGQPVTLAHGG